MADSLRCSWVGAREVSARKLRLRAARPSGLVHGLSLLVSALVIWCGPHAALAGGHVPSPTARPTTGKETQTATPTPTAMCDLPIPVARIAPDPVHSGELVTLDGSTSTGTFSVLRWGQLAGPRVMITDAQSLTASFIAPPVVEPTVVTMQLALTSPCTPTILVVQADVTILRPAGVALIAVEDVTVTPGEPGVLDVRLYSDLPTVRIEHDLALDPGIAIGAAADGHPQCSVPAELGATEAEFEFLPAGCSGDGCTGIHVAIAAADAIADGALVYRCAIAASGSSPSFCNDYPYDCCQHPLGCDVASAYDAAGSAVPARCVEGTARIAYPQAAADFVFTIDPPEPRVGDRVHITVDIVPAYPGLIGMPIFGLQGTQPFFSGETSPRHPPAARQVTYDLQAVRAGTAELSMSVTFETKLGCPGNEFFSFDGLHSQTVPVTIAPAPCPGDCSGDGRVNISELIIGVNLALNGNPESVCPALNCSAAPAVSIDCLIGAVHNALYGCPG